MTGTGSGKLAALLGCLLSAAFLLSKQAGWRVFGSTQYISKVPSVPMTDATSGRLFEMQRIRSFVSGTSEFHDTATLMPLLDETGQPFPICDVWAVITSINPPTKTVSQLAAMPDVCVCVVADIKSPAAYNVQSVVYLTTSIQERLPYNIMRHVPWNHFGRKNVGFLFAIHHGAQVIYDTDDDNEINGDRDVLPHLHQSMTSLFLDLLQDERSNDTTSLNPYPFFGASHAWPRGFPLDEVRPSTKGGMLPDVVQAEAKNVAVIQSLADHDPDVDAIYRISSLPLPFNFPPNGDGDILALPSNDLMSPYNAQATLHFHRAFWGLILPITVHGRVSDIWRSFFSQRLFWETGDVLAFAAPWVSQFRNPHNYMADFEAETDLYRKSAALVRYLESTWRCNGTLTLESCLEDIYIDMYNHAILDKGDIDLVRAWIDDLQRVGYKFPARQPNI